MVGAVFVACIVLFMGANTRDPKAKADANRIRGANQGDATELKLAKDYAVALDANVDAVTSMEEAKNNQYDDVRQAELGLEYAKALLEEDFKLLKLHYRK